MTTTTDKGKSHTDEELLAIVDAATRREWSADTPCFDQKIPIRGGITAYGRPYVIAHVNRPGSSYAGQAAKDAAFIATFDPPTVRSLIERARAAEKELALRAPISAEELRTICREHEEVVKAAEARALAAEKERDEALALAASHHSERDQFEARAIAAEEALKAASNALEGEYAGLSSPSRHVSAAKKIIDQALYSKGAQS